MPTDPSPPPRPCGARCAGRHFRRSRYPAAIWDATRELLDAIAEANAIDTVDIASVFFTTTVDLRCAFPARAARQLGWVDVPLLGATEQDQPGAPERASACCCTGTLRAPGRGDPVYLRGADSMRVDDPPSHLSDRPGHDAGPPPVG